MNYTGISQRIGGLELELVGSTLPPTGLVKVHTALPSIQFRYKPTSLDGATVPQIALMCLEQQGSGDPLSGGKPAWNPLLIRGALL